MKQILTGRIPLVVAKYGEQAPAATVCCNACRSCVTTNLASAVILGLTGLVGLAQRLAHVRKT
jgi:hypothetical protein